MTPLTLERPTRHDGDSEHATTVGNDGLTDAERQELALNYLAGPARRTLSEQERSMLAAWRERRQGA